MPNRRDTFEYSLSEAEHKLTRMNTIIKAYEKIVKEYQEYGQESKRAIFGSINLVKYLKGPETEQVEKAKQAAEKVIEDEDDVKKRVSRIAKKLDNVKK